MTKLNLYLYFYLMGRKDDEIPCSIDIDPLAARVLAGEKLRDVTHDAASRACAAAELDGFESKWLRDFRSEIDEAGGDGKQAYAQYRMAVIDELASSLEFEVLTNVQETLDATDFEERASERATPMVEDEGDGVVGDEDDGEEGTDSSRERSGRSGRE